MSTRWGRISVSSTETALSAHGCKFTLLALYVAVNVLLFVRSARIEWELNTGFQRYVISVARGCGQLVNLNLAILLTFASRSLTCFLRETAASVILPLDRMLPAYHSYAGIIVFVAGAVHGIAQSAVYILKKPWSPTLTGKTSVCITGALLCVSLGTIGISTLRTLRQSHYEIFYILHLGGSAITFICFILHGLNRGKFTGWKWIVGPLSLYVIDQAMRTLRIRRSYLLVSKHSAGFHGPNVVKIRLPRLFHFEAGQYAELQVPEISRWQWHPFTIASAPHEDEMVFYVKVAGNWTNELYNIFCSRDHSETPGDVEVHVRGPFGAPSQHVGEYDHVILIGAGVGATPFCSVTKNAQYILENWRPAPPRPVAHTRRRLRNQKSKSSSSGGSRSPSASNGSAHETHIIDLEDAISMETNTDIVPRKRLDVELSTTIPDSNLSTCELPHDVSITTDNGTMYTAHDDRTLSMYTARDHVSISLGSDEITPAPLPDAPSRDHVFINLEEDAVEPVPCPPLPGRIPRRYARLSEIRNQMDSRQTGSKQNHGSVAFSNSIEARPHIQEDRVRRVRENGSETLGGRSDTEPFYTANNIQQISETYHTSLNMLVGMNFGSVSLVKSAQFRQACADSKRIPPEVNTPERAVGLNIFRSPTLMFLLFMRSVTMQFIMVWILILRLLNLGVAAALGKISIVKPGLSLYKSRALVAIDLALVLTLCVLMIVPLLIELVEVGVLARHGMEGLIMTPILLLGVTCDILSLCNIGREVEILNAVQVFALWPFTTALVLIRLIRVIRERISDGGSGNRFKDIFTTKSLEFYWTSQTALDDAWLLHELRECGNSSVVQLHRYLTRESECEHLLSGMNENAFERDITKFGRPDWTQVFNEAACKAKNGTVIGVFFCGPATMSREVQKAATQAMRDSIVRGLQLGAYSRAFRELEEVFGDALTTNDIPAGNGEPNMGANIRFVYRKEKFS